MPARGVADPMACLPPRVVARLRQRRQPASEGQSVRCISPLSTATSTQEELEHAREGPYRGPQGQVQKKKKKKKKTGGTDSEPADGAVRV